MSATPAEREMYAAKSRKWNSLHNNKFPLEFPAEHAANLEWIKKQEEQAALQQGEGELNGTVLQGTKAREDSRKRSDGIGKWILLGVIGAIVILRALQRYREMVTV